MSDEPRPEERTLLELNQLLLKVLRELAAAGKQDEACSYAGQAWSVLRHEFPREAERHNGLLHYLTAPHKTPQTIKT